MYHFSKLMKRSALKIYYYLEDVQHANSKEEIYPTTVSINKQCTGELFALKCKKNKNPM